MLIVSSLDLDSSPRALNKVNAEVRRKPNKVRQNYNFFVFLFLSACEYSRWPTLSRFPLFLNTWVFCQYFSCFCWEFSHGCNSSDNKSQFKDVAITWWKTIMLFFVLFPFFFFSLFHFVLFCLVLFFQTYWKLTSLGRAMGAYTHCKGFLLFDCYVSISRTLKIPFS